MKLLLHTCCAPCAIKCIDYLKQESITPDLYWYNPNIHPYTEYKCRKEALAALAAKRELFLAERDEYGLRRFIDEAGSKKEGRCKICYQMRFDKAAEYAVNNKYDGFSSTLLISPYQNHALLKELGEKTASAYGISFVYRDFRPLFREGQKEAREQGFYMQKYCGCIYSEEERYLKKEANSDK